MQVLNASLKIIKEYLNLTAVIYIDKIKFSAL